MKTSDCFCPHCLTIKLSNDISKMAYSTVRGKRVGTSKWSPSFVNKWSHQFVYFTDIFILWVKCTQALRASNGARSATRFGPIPLSRLIVKSPCWEGSTKLTFIFTFTFTEIPQLYSPAVDGALVDARRACVQAILNGVIMKAHKVTISQVANIISSIGSHTANDWQTPWVVWMTTKSGALPLTYAQKCKPSFDIQNEASL